MDNVAELEGKGSWRNLRRDAETWGIKEVSEEPRRPATVRFSFKICNGKFEFSV